MTAEDERRMIDMLSRIVQRSREMQEEGHLGDRRSRIEADLLEQMLRVSRARLASRMSSELDGLGERAEALVALAQETCRISESVRRTALATQQKTRRVRKRLYRARLITGSM